MSSDLKRQRDRFVAFAFAGADLLIEVGPDNRTSFVAGAAQRLLGTTAQAQIGRPILDLFPPSEHGLMAALLLDRETQERFGPVRTRTLRDGGAPAPALLSGCRLPGSPDMLYLALSVPTVALAAEADPDDSGLLDAETFARRTAETIRAAQALGQELKLTLIDMVGIERMREQAGAGSADRLLAEATDLLRSRSVGNATARLADDKFGLLHDAGVDAEGLRRRIAEMARRAAPQGPEIAVAGRTIAADGDLDETEMARALAYVMNSFVSSGAKDLNITSMTGALRSLMDDTIQRVADFKSLVSSKGMQLRFQPIVELASRQPHHYEVLVRFEKDESPYELIRFAESMHLVHEMDFAVCESAIAWLAGEAAADRGGAGRSGPDRPVALAVNLSAQSLQNAIFVERLLGLLRRHPGLAPRLVFEITESAELRDLAAANAVIQQLRGLGHGMCLDDFGAGFASFQYLQSLHVDYVKLDGQYIRPVLDSPRDRVMLKAMVGLCRDLGIRTVAEMIETETQASLLSGIGVAFGQGWLFGKPAPRPEPPAGSRAMLETVTMAGRRQGPRESWG